MPLLKLKAMIVLIIIIIINTQQRRTLSIARCLSYIIIAVHLAKRNVYDCCNERITTTTKKDLRKRNIPTHTQTHAHTEVSHMRIDGGGGSALCVKRTNARIGAITITKSYHSK